MASSSIDRAISAATLAAMTCIAAPALAQEQCNGASPVEIAGNVTVVSNYLSRGVSLSDNRPALQASMTVSHDSGFYASAWASNTRFGEARAELDLGVGYSREIADTVFDVSYIRYFFPGDRIDGDSGEIHLSASRTQGAVTAKAGVLYSWDTPFGRDAAYPYVETRITLPTSTPLVLSGHLGYFDYRRGRTAPYQNYLNWNLAVATRLRDYDLSFAYADTDVSGETGRRLAKGRLVVSVGRNF